MSYISHDTPTFRAPAPAGPAPGAPPPPAAPAPRATRSDGWTTARQLGFFEELAAHGNVERAAAAVDMSASSAYRLRSRDDAGAFGTGWRAASAMAYYRLRAIAIDRVTNGVTMPQLYRGEMVSTRTVFSDRLLLGMLDHLRPVAGAPAADGARRPLPDPAIAYAAAIGAFAEAVETGAEPAVPLVDDGTGPGNGPTIAELRAICRRDQRRADRWFDVMGAELTVSELANEEAMACLDRDVREKCAAEIGDEFDSVVGSRLN